MIRPYLLVALISFAAHSQAFVKREEFARDLTQLGAIVTAGGRNIALKAFDEYSTVVPHVERSLRLLEKQFNQPATPRDRFLVLEKSAAPTIQPIFRAWDETFKFTQKSLTSTGSAFAEKLAEMGKKYTSGVQ